MALLLVLGQTKGRKTITYGFLQALSQSFWSREITSFFTFLCLFHNFLAFRTDFLPNGNISTSYRLETHSLTEGRTQIEGWERQRREAKTDSVCLVFCVLVFVPLDPLSLFSKTRCSASLAAVWAPTSLLSFLFAFSPVEENPCLQLSLGERDKG